MPYLTDKEMKVVKAYCDDVREALGDNVIEIKLFGSRARGEGDEESDIDIFILLKKSSVEIRNLITRILVDYQLEYDMCLAPIEFSLYEYEKNREMRSPFTENLLKEGVPV